MTKPLLIVESDAMVAAAQALLPAYDVLTVDQATHALANRPDDWQGVNVDVWPTVGSERPTEVVAWAAAQAGATVRYVRPNGQPTGWSLLTAREGLWTKEATLEWARAHIEPWGKERDLPDHQSGPAPTEEPPPPAEAQPAQKPAKKKRASKKSEPAPETPEDGGAELPPEAFEDGGLPTDTDTSGQLVRGRRGHIQQWEDTGLVLMGNGNPYISIDNAVRVFGNSPALKDSLYYDTFSHAVMLAQPDGELQRWSDETTVSMTLFMQRELGLQRMGTNIVREAAIAYALAHPRNPLQDYLNGLQWDQTERLPTVLADAFGCPQDDYHAAAGRCWFVSMAARGLRPGCQVDTMPVLEGGQGIKKTTALRILGGDWFSECHESMLTKDFQQHIEGRWLVEISELHCFRRAEIERIKGILTTRVDRYRSSYGRFTTDHERQCTFSGTTNSDSWNMDDTGARRFLPVKCVAIDSDYLAQTRDQLFAEAVARLRRDEPWWDIPEAAHREQTDDRFQEDPWHDLIEPYTFGKPEVDMAYILSGTLELKPHQADRTAQLRVASVLRRLGFKRIVKRQGTKTYRAWVKQNGE